MTSREDLLHGLGWAVDLIRKRANPNGEEATLFLMSATRILDEEGKARVAETGANAGLASPLTRSHSNPQPQPKD